MRTAIFNSATELVGWLLQQAAQRIDEAYQPKPGEVRKSRETVQAQGIFGRFKISRDYYYHAGKERGRYPADDALGLEVCYTPALAKLICLEGADEPTYLKAERYRPVRFSGWSSGSAAPPSNGRSGQQNRLSASAVMRPSCM